jgi:hypothetical protein
MSSVSDREYNAICLDELVIEDAIVRFTRDAPVTILKEPANVSA